ncbi:MAG: transposase family protein, partial [Nitrospirae bacterium]|nr:transposase family protein [Nitrospirota bacterium]
MICLLVKIKRHLSFGALRQAFSIVLEQVSEHREKGKVEYSVHNVLMSGFAMMFFQDSSMLEFQRKMETWYRQNNLRTMFKVDSIPKDNQMRNVLDEVDPKELEPIFDEYFYRLQRGKYLDLYRFMDNAYLVSMDGSEYFGS